MKLKSYKEILKLGKEKVEELKAPIRAKQMKSKAEGEVLELDIKLMDLENKINDLACEYPINFNKMIDAIDEKDLLERRKKQFHQIVEQMFPDE